MNESQGNDDLWGYEDVAAYLGVSWKTVRKWAQERRIPIVKVGALNRFRPSDIRAWVASNAHPVTDGPDEVA
jgi:excisionase family DNA binding protein